MPPRRRSARRRRRPAAFLALTLAALASAAGGLLVGRDGGREQTSARALAYGIDVQSFRDFGDPRLAALGVRRVRIVVSWDVVEAGERGFREGDPNQPGELENLDRWIAAARSHGYQPLVAFGVSRTHPRTLPSVPAYARAARAFLDRYAKIGGSSGDRGPRELALTAWNEPNHPAQPTLGRPERAAAYYSALRRLCAHRCRAVAGELAQIVRYERGPRGVCGRPAGSRACNGRRFRADGERVSQAAFVRRYRAAIRGPAPAIWGYHPYADVNGTSGGPRGDGGTRAFARVALGRGGRGELWLTEAGGVLEDGPGGFELDDEQVAASPAPSGSARPTPQEREQGAEIRHLLGPVAHADPRIQRLYYYLFRARGLPTRRGCRNYSRFDSGLVRECAQGASVPRPAYEVFKRGLE